MIERSVTQIPSTRMAQTQCFPRLGSSLGIPSKHLCTYTPMTATVQCHHHPQLTNHNPCEHSQWLPWHMKRHNFLRLKFQWLASLIRKPLKGFKRKQNLGTGNQQLENNEYKKIDTNHKQYNAYSTNCIPLVFLCFLCCFNHFRKHLLNEFPVSRMSSVVNLSKAVHRCGLGIAVCPFSTQTNAVHTKHFELGSSWKAASWAMGELARNFAKNLFGEERLPETNIWKCPVFSLPTAMFLP